VPLRRRIVWLITFAVAMAYVESAVVVYLRAIYYPQGFAFPLVLMPPGMVAIEMGREIATLVMLLGLAMLAGADRWDRILVFCVGFGVWDIAYYIWLWVFLRWPPSLLTWDVLFLIPVPWIGPVVAPVIVSVVMVVGALLLLGRRAGGQAAGRSGGQAVGFPLSLRLLALAGGVLVLAAFMLDFQVVVRQMEPPPFRWGLFGTGVGLAVVALVLALGRKA
jgi:hypothetical protein